MATTSVEGVVFFILVLCSSAPSLATVYTVGDLSGWALAVNYSDWSIGKTVSVGDKLVFNYASGHTVDEVSEIEYNNCTVGNGNSLPSDSSGPISIKLKTAGTHYFICAIIGHCSSGQKLAITVSPPAGATPTPPSAGISSPSTTDTSLPRVVHTTPNDIGNSSSGTLTPFEAALMICLVPFFKFVLF